MGDSPVALNIETIPWGGQEHVIKTSHGPISVFVCGDQCKPCLITYSDVALNYLSCFQGLLLCPEASALLFHNFCIYHIDAPGHELGAAAFDTDKDLLSAEDLSEQVCEIVDYFGLQAVVCMGVMAGAYILTRFAINHSERVLGLILVTPLYRMPSWSEWFYNKLLEKILYYYGMCGYVKEALLQRYFSQDLRGGNSGAESDIVRACRKLLDERRSGNVLRYLQAIHQRTDLTAGLRKLRCRTLIFVGEQSPFYKEAIHMSKQLDPRVCALVEVQACGSLVTEEQPHSMLVPMELFLMGMGFYSPQHLACYYRSTSPSSPLSPLCIAPELLSPQSLGLNLKPIKTRISSAEELV